MIEIYTDGACLGNPGQGGYGIVLKFGVHEKELSAGYKFTTNNRMELLAVIVALESLTRKVKPATITSDSKYVINSINKGWVFNWAKHADFKGKKNEDLWRRFIKIYRTFPEENLTFEWVKGHNGHPENERCDVLAVDAAEGGDLLDDEGYTKSLEPTQEEKVEHQYSSFTDEERVNFNDKLKTLINDDLIEFDILRSGELIAIGHFPAGSDTIGREDSPVQWDDVIKNN
jgi:ribonuclease HI